jgi:glycosyltransferase involved in cell wall biosynthesis
LKNGVARLAILCPGFGRVMRGVETLTGELSSYLTQSATDWEIDIFCRGPTKRLSDKVRQIHVPAVDRNSRLATLYAQFGHRMGIFLRTRIDAECLSFTLALAPRILYSHYDVVFNQAGPFAGALLKLKRKLDGTPFVHATASGYSDLELVMARQRPNVILANSPFVKDWLANNFPDLRIECVPNAVDCSVFRPYSQEELAALKDKIAIFNLKKPIVLFVGAIDPMKRPELLIRAVAQLDNVSLAMVGSGRIEPEIVRLGSKLLDGRFLHIPVVSREQIAAYYNACDLFTLPSEEPFGIVFLEAMACNKPVLGHRSPVQDWIFGDAGETCDCTNVIEYAHAIQRLISSDFGTRPLMRSRAFDWTVVGPQYARLLREVAESRG